MAFRLVPRLEAIASMAASKSLSKRRATGTFFDLAGAGVEAPEMNFSAAFISMAFVSLFGLRCTAIVYHLYIILIYTETAYQADQFGYGVGIAGF